MVAGSQLVSCLCLSHHLSDTHTHSSSSSSYLHRSCLCAAVACLPQHTRSTAKHKPRELPVTGKQEQGPKPQPPSTAAAQSGIKVTRAVTRAARLLHAGLLLPRPNLPAAQASRARTMFAGAHSSCKCLCHPTSKEGARSGSRARGERVSGIRCLLETRLGKGQEKEKKR